MVSPLFLTQANRLGFAFKGSELLQILLKRYRSSNAVKVEVAVAGDLKNTVEPSHNTGQISFQI